MNICILGYFGQNNFGDEITNIITCALIRAEFGAGTNVYIINQGMFDSREDHTAENVANLIAPFEMDLNIHAAWFDSIHTADYDVLIVNNGGFGKWFMSDIVLAAAARKIPTRIHCVKAGRPDEPRGEAYATAIAASEYAIFRSIHEHASVADIPSAILGLDIALVPDIWDKDDQRSGKLIIAQRFSSDSNLNMMQVIYASLIASEWQGETILFASCQGDRDLAAKSAHIVDCDRVMILNAWEDPISSMRELTSSKAVLSFGRRHPLLFAAISETPCAMIDFKKIPDTVSVKDELPCRDHGVYILPAPNLPIDPTWFDNIITISGANLSDMRIGRENSINAIGKELLAEAEAIIRRSEQKHKSDVDWSNAIGIFED